MEYQSASGRVIKTGITTGQGLGKMPAGMMRGSEISGTGKPGSEEVGDTIGPQDSLAGKPGIGLLNEGESLCSALKFPKSEVSHCGAEGHVALAEPRGGLAELYDRLLVTAAKRGDRGSNQERLRIGPGEPLVLKAGRIALGRSDE